MCVSILICIEWVDVRVYILANFHTQVQIHGDEDKQTNIYHFVYQYTKRYKLKPHNFMKVTTCTHVRNTHGAGKEVVYAVCASVCVYVCMYR